MIMPDAALTISVSKNRPGAEANIELSYTSGTCILTDLNLVGPNVAKRYSIHTENSPIISQKLKNTQRHNSLLNLTQHPSMFRNLRLCCFTF